MQLVVVGVQIGRPLQIRSDVWEPGRGGVHGTHAPRQASLARAHARVDTVPYRITIFDY